MNQQPGRYLFPEQTRAEYIAGNSAGHGTRQAQLRQTGLPHPKRAVQYALSFVQLLTLLTSLGEGRGARSNMKYLKTYETHLGQIHFCCESRLRPKESKTDRAREHCIDSKDKRAPVTKHLRQRMDISGMLIKLVVTS